VLNLQIAKAYLAGTDNGIATRTWQSAMESLITTKQEENQKRWRTAAKDPAFLPLLARVIIETPGELLLQVMEAGTVSTNVFLRRLHNFCADMGWLPWPLIPQMAMAGCEIQSETGNYAGGTPADHRRRGEPRTAMDFKNRFSSPVGTDINAVGCRERRPTGFVPATSRTSIVEMARNSRRAVFVRITMR
jgi:hypothetical protein